MDCGYRRDVKGALYKMCPNIQTLTDEEYRNGRCRLGDRFEHTPLVSLDTGSEITARNGVCYTRHVCRL